MYEEALYTGENSHKQRYFWIIDSDAAQHMTHDKDSLSDFAEFKQSTSIILSDNSYLWKKDLSVIHLYTGGQPHKIALHDIYLPDLGRNLLSVCAIKNHGAVVEIYCLLLLTRNIPKSASQVRHGGVRLAQTSASRQNSDIEWVVKQ